MISKKMIIAFVGCFIFLSASLVYAQIFEKLKVGTAESFEMVELRERGGNIMFAAMDSAMALASIDQDTPYDFDIVSKKGDALESFVPTGFGLPSINNNEKISFVMRDDSGLDGRLIIVDDDGIFDSTWIQPPEIMSDFTQINDQNRVVYHRDEQNPRQTFVVRFQGDSGEVLGWGSLVLSDGAPFDKVYPWASMNDHGRGVFGGLLDGDTLLLSRDSGSGTYTGVIIETGEIALFPMISTSHDAYTNRIIMRAGSSATAPIILFEDQTFTGNYALATSSGFIEIGNKPGISDDGIVMVYMGDSRSEGRGVFVTALNSSFNGYQFKLMDVPAGSPLSFCVSANNSGTGNFVYRVVYMAENGDGVLGLYSRDVDISVPGAPVADDPVLIVQLGDTIDGLTGEVNYFNIYDPVNNSGQVVFLAKTTTGEEAIIRAYKDFNYIDKWWATVNDAPIDVTWLLSVSGASGTDDYVLSIAFDRPMDATTTWNISSGTNIAIRDAETESLIRNVSLTPLASTTMGADIGPLDPGIYTFTFEGFNVPQRPVVHKVTFGIYGSGDFLTPYKKLEALFVADHLPNDEIVNISIDGEPDSKNYSQLVELFLPVLKFDDGSDPDAEGGAERYTHAYDASEIFSVREPLNEPISGALDQDLDLSGYATGTPAGNAVIYGSVLRKSDVMTLGGNPDEIAINYWFHYPRSNWKEHGGFNTHEGDWEGVTVFLKEDAGYFKPDRVAFGQHVLVLPKVDIEPVKLDGGDIVYWSDIEKSNVNVFVYVGLGGHASYFSSGKTNWLMKDLTIQTEFHNGQLSATQAASSVFLNRITDDTPLWLRFPGTWGKIIGKLDETSGDDGPPGPAFLSLRFGYGARWLNPWKWSGNFSEAEPVASAETTSGDFSIDGNEATLTANTADALIQWDQVEARSLATYVQFNVDFLQPGDGDVLEVLINDQVVGSIIGTDFTSTGELQMSEPFDISAYRDQTVSLGLRLRQVGPVPAQVVISDVSIVYVDLADLEPGSVTYMSGTYKRGEEFVITVDVDNIGTFDKLSSQTFAINVVLSSDDEIDENNNVLATFDFNDFLAAGDNRSINETITVPSNFPTGTYYLGVVLDADEEIAELDEDNNTFISAASNVTITPDTSKPVPTVSITVTPSTITLGDSTELSWSSTDSVSCQASGDWSGSKDASGTENVMPYENAQYVLMCSGDGGDASDIVNVTVNIPAPQISNISPTSGYIGDQVTITGNYFGLDYSSFNFDPRADIDNSGFVNFLDYSLFSQWWQARGEDLRADLNHDGTVDNDDLQIFSGAWLSSRGSNYVVFNNNAVADVISWDSNQIVVEVPFWAESGPVKVVTSGGESNTVNFTVNPTITGLVPAVAAVGEEVVLTGYAWGEAQNLPQPSLADLNHDGEVDYADYILFHKYWKMAQKPRGVKNKQIDFNKDGKINGRDVVFFMREWTKSFRRLKQYVIFANHTKGEIVGWEKDRITVKVPKNARSGKMYLQSGRKHSNRVEFEVNR